MRFGACHDLDRAEQIEYMGYDFIEGSVSQIAAMSEAEFGALLDIFAKVKIRCEVNRGLFPGSMQLIGSSLTDKEIREYLRNAFDRVARLGTEVVVFGSGAARKAPEGISPEQAMKRLAGVGQIVSEEARPYGLICAVEPLNSQETNTVNLQLDGLRLVKAVSQDNFLVLSDYFHLTVMGEGPEEVKACKGYMAHTHIANPNGRTIPADADESDYTSFFRALKEIGYQDRLSVEAVPARNAEEELAKAISVLRTLDERTS